MPCRGYEPGSPEEWLLYAKSELALARTADSPDSHIGTMSLCSTRV
uniref:Uncharacterized protein n=1 Tax=Candidatus Kentrum sp. MB TaxID=2138164 RepID=A0A451BF30_9GAMM|nr:MAG: hypothetical protein BECKMB1821G_GA0114241_10779 [Candidatus Kentron sp. MB]VFK34563.1 MAG: hypothetical protein BECKMB1821I_GA0114274_10768 [Candidatus Kentron sp. MB]VFK76880.1 MAG: hypothetical protein BECKMB1821H_GA0114242_10807 [Candidatus Kentron sp. MB]